jgi:predicted metal-dependent RNase
MINLHILGGFQEYGRNCFLIEHEETDTRIMLDCGVQNGQPEVYPPLTPEIAQSLDAVFLSHVHNDHIGALPLLADMGYEGTVWLSKASFAQLDPIQQHWKQRNNAPYPTTAADKLHFIPFSPESRGQSIALSEHLSFEWGHSGHMLGSVWYIFHFGEESLFYSGDMVLDSITFQTESPAQSAFQLAIIDSGHGGQVTSRTTSEQTLLRTLNDSEVSYRIPVSLSGKACDLILTIYKQLPGRQLFLDQAVWNHLADCLSYAANLNFGMKELLENLLRDERVTILSTDHASEAGIYFTTKKISGTKYIPIDSAAHPELFFKAHPDQKDVEKLLQSIQADRLVFFHSKPQDFSKLIAYMPKELTLNGGVFK